MSQLKQAGRTHTQKGKFQLPQPLALLRISGDWVMPTCIGQGSLLYRSTGASANILETPFQTLQELTLKLGT
jgi:hypothetical protein